MSVVVEKKIDGVNRTVLARGLGLTRSYVSQVLSGKREPGLGVAIKVARGLGLTVEQLGEYLTRKGLVN
jgi:transcriptional regulator with XRE-family HTH domain